jgi:two-component system LytT family sensor kinase
MSDPIPNRGREPFYVEESAVRRGRVQTRPEMRAKVALTLAMWGSTYLLFTLGNLLNGKPGQWTAAGVRAFVMTVGIALCYALHRLLRRLAHRPFRTRALVLAATAPFAAEAYAWLGFFAYAWLHGTSMRMVIADWAVAANVLSQWTWFFIGWAGLYLAIEYNFDAKDEAQRSAELRNLAHNAKLRALSNQINPHFLFNSLNSISALILEGRAHDAERMLTGLSTFFRSTLSIDPLVDVALEQEFDLHRRYLAIEQMRYPDLTVDFDLPEALKSAAVPALILQPLVENAVKHGVAKSMPPTWIGITAQREGDMLSITVANTAGGDGHGAAVRGDGIGLANVRERLSEHHGAAQSVAVSAGPDLFEVRITLPIGFAR